VTTTCTNSGPYAGVRIFTDKGARTQCPDCGHQWIDGAGISPDYLPTHDVFDPAWVQPKVGTEQTALA
jgi:hypothetical protein